jgi:hypothetical protein
MTYDELNKLTPFERALLEKLGEIKDAIKDLAKSVDGD